MIDEIKKLTREEIVAGGIYRIGCTSLMKVDEIIAVDSIYFKPENYIGLRGTFISKEYTDSDLDHHKMYLADNKSICVEIQDISLADEGMFYRRALFQFYDIAILLGMKSEIANINRKILKK